MTWRPLPTITGASAVSRFFRSGGDEVFPCRCGTTHVGPYAACDWAHHNCFHREPLVEIDPEIGGYVSCPSCGEIFWTAKGHSEWESS